MEQFKANEERLEKCCTGIAGLDELTNGGLPKGRTTLIAGGPGCGKTVLGMEFLVNGIREFQEPGVFISFEENIHNLHVNFRSMGFDLNNLMEKELLYVDHVDVLGVPVIETGEFSMAPLFLRLEYAIMKVGAKRIVLDTIEAIFSALTNKQILRTEIKRLFSWLYENNITTVVTGEREGNSITRQGLEEYVSDCVILLDHRVEEQISKRRLRIVKYRGSEHVADECPFLIDKGGFKVLPVTSLSLDHSALNVRISSGVPDLDEMMEGKGFFKASSILVTGTAGTGKSSLAASFAHAACSHGQVCLYFSFEESQDQICRNMGSIGLELSSFIKSEKLHILSERTSTLGLEEHLTKILHIIEQKRPNVVIIDPISNFLTVGRELEIKTMLTRLLDYLKMNEITGFFTSLADPDMHTEKTNTAISSVMDTWLVLRDYYNNNTKRRLFYLLKARGMDHSREVKEMKLSARGISLVEPDFAIINGGGVTG